MKDLYLKLNAHYNKPKLYEEIVSRLEEQGIKSTQVRRSDISGVDEFHVRGGAVSKELASSIEMKGKKVLDVGCGLGGPCRMLAEEYDCVVTGVDLSEEYIRTAKELSKLVGLEDKTTFVQGDATELSFKDAVFDVVWTQHVQMNVPDKEKLYSEIARVLRPGGYFLFYDILKKGRAPVTYPMPWADSSELSFLINADVMEYLISSKGLVLISKTDQTQAGIDFFESLLAKIGVQGPPKIGLNVLMGESTLPKLLNLLSHLKMGAIELMSGVYQKPQ